MVLSQYFDRCWVAREQVELSRHCHSNIVATPSLLRLHRAVTSVPSDSYPLPGLQRGVPGRAPRKRPPTLPRGGLAACEEGQWQQETINLIALDELVKYFARSG